MFLWQGEKWRLKTTHADRPLTTRIRYTRLILATQNSLAEVTDLFKLIEIAKYYNNHNPGFSKPFL